MGRYYYKNSPAQTALRATYERDQDRKAAHATPLTIKREEPGLCFHWWVRRWLGNTRVTVCKECGELKEVV